MQQKHHRIDTIGERFLFQALQRFIYRIVSQDVVDIGFDPSFQKHFNGAQRIGTPVPAHGNRPAILLADVGQILRHSVSGGGEIGHDIVFAADL